MKLSAAIVDLERAAESNDVELAKRALQRAPPGARFDRITSATFVTETAHRHARALRLAAARNHHEIVRLLLETDQFSPKARQIGDDNAFQLAIKNNCHEAARVICDYYEKKGKNHQAHVSYYADYALEHGDAKMLQCFLSLGDVDDFVRRQIKEMVEIYEKGEYDDLQLKAAVERCDEKKMKVMQDFMYKRKRPRVKYAGKKRRTSAPVEIAVGQ